MEVYIDDPSEEQYNLLSSLFEEWCKSGRSNLLHHMFEIIESHESPKIRDLVIENMKKYSPDSTKQDILELWITHPLPRMREFIAEMVESKNLEDPVKSAAYVMLDDYEALNEIDPDFHHLDIYLRTVDPLLGSLLIQKVEQLKNPSANGALLRTPEEDEDEEVSLMDRIRKRDFTYIWENILDYPVPFVAEVLHIMQEEEWVPVDESGQELFEILIEQFGTTGWYAIDHCKWVVMSKKIGSKFEPLSRVDIDRGSFELQFSQDLVFRPDRITNQKFQNRGRFNLSDPQLGLNIYMESVRRSDFDGLLHVPIYSNNGVELVEFTIPANSEKNFAMDEDGLYFSIKNKEGIFTVDLDALAAFLLPISRHSEMINQMIPILLERANEDQKMPIRAMNLLSTLHRGREFSLWDKKQTVEWDDGSKPTDSTCQCTISIDLGNTSTKISQVVKGECDHELQSWSVPTIIYYRSPNDYIIGEEVMENDLAGTSQTFQNIKYSLKYGSRKHLRIQNNIVTSYDAYKNFLLAVIDKIESEVDIEMSSIAMTFPAHAPSGFEGWLRGILQTRGFDRIELTDEISASAIGSYRLNNQRGNVMIIDIGSSHMAAAVVDMNTNKSRKRLEESRMREDFDDNPEIIAKVSVDQGSLEISELMFTAANFDTTNFNELQFTLNGTKQELSSEFSGDVEFEEKTISYGMDDDAEINIDSLFTSSDLFYSFKILLRNVMVKANLRGVSKKNLDTVLILGKGSQWPGFLEYIKRIFEDKEVIIENDIYLTSKGAGLVANGQELAIKLEEDILLKVAKNGIVGYETVLSRGESPLGSSKEFEIRPHSWMEKLVLDCWVRRPTFIADEEVQPMKDDQNLGHNTKTRKLFSYDRVFRQIVDLDGDSILKVNTSSRGTLYFEVETGEKTISISTDTSIY